MRGFRHRAKPHRVVFYPEPVDRGDKWRLQAHRPGSPVKYTSAFNTKAEAEAWASSPDAIAWISANYQSAAREP
jgi:hypothetical protein